MPTHTLSHSGTASARLRRCLLRALQPPLPPPPTPHGHVLMTAIRLAGALASWELRQQAQRLVKVAPQGAVGTGEAR